MSTPETFLIAAIVLAVVIGLALFGLSGPAGDFESDVDFVLGYLREPDNPDRGDPYMMTEFTNRPQWPAILAEARRRLAEDT